MNKPSSLVTFLLDRSGSMQSCKPATIEGFNAYLAGLKSETEADITFTFLQFDSQSLDKLCVAVPVSDAALLNEATFQPRGGTPLIDASVKTIQAVEASLSKREDSPRVVICIQTDGQENQSRDHTWEELRGVIAAKQAQGWEFNFLGAGIDAYAQGARMGIGAMNTMSYDMASPDAVKSAFVASAENTRSFAVGRAASTAYSAQNRLDAGDAYAGTRLPASTQTTPGQRRLAPQRQPVNTNLDLTPPAPKQDASILEL